MNPQRHLEKGAEIEARMATHDGYIWHSAVVTRIDSDFIFATYASGHPVKLRRDEPEKYRLPAGSANG